MLAKRIIPCLDIKNGKVVKGINFVGLKDIGNPVELAKMYNKQGADEIVFLDITATYEERNIMKDIIQEAANELSIPLCVGGGIRNLEDFENILGAGADKVAVNSAAIKDPSLIYKASQKYGSQCVVVAIDAKKKEENKWEVYLAGGRVNTHIDLIEWVKQAENLGAGEFLLTSMDKDGTRDGFDIEMLVEVLKVTNVPVIASGGCGEAYDIVSVFKKTNVDAALAASLFHYQEATIDDVKKLCEQNQIAVRRDI